MAECKPMKANGRQRYEGDLTDLSAAIKPFVLATGAAFVDYSESPTLAKASMCVELLVKEKDIIIAMRKVGRNFTQQKMYEAVAAVAPSHFTPPAKNSWSLCMSRRLRNMLNHVEIAEDRPSPPKWFIENFLEAAPSAAASSGGETSSGRKQVAQQTTRISFPITTPPCSSPWVCSSASRNSTPRTRSPSGN